MGADEDWGVAVYRTLEAALVSVLSDSRGASRFIEVQLSVEQACELMGLLADMNPALAPRCDCPRDHVDEALAGEGCALSHCPYRFVI